MKALLKTQFGHPKQPTFFDDFFGKEFFGYIPASVKTIPAVNVKEDETNFTVEVAAPGMNKDNFNISLEDGILTISSESKSENTETDDKTKYTRKEFSYSSFKRSFTIDEEQINTEAISARYENGVLFVALPKQEKVEPEKKSKTISIS